jgi:cell shape-determining protein MreD
MKTWLTGAVTVIAAYVVFALIGPLAAPGAVIADVFTVAVLLFGTIRGEIPGAVMGAACGLIVDAFSLGVFGLAGLVLTPAGYLAGFISRKINIVRWYRMLLFFFVLAVAAFSAWAGLTAAVARSPLPWAGGFLVLRPVATTAACALFYDARRRFKARHDR